MTQATIEATKVTVRTMTQAVDPAEYSTRGNSSQWTQGMQATVKVANICLVRTKYDEYRTLK